MIKYTDMCFEMSFSIYNAVYKRKVKRDTVGERLEDKVRKKEDVN